MKKLSVVMSVYNGAATVRATMESILAQTLTDFELIVVDDGSKDATPDILAGYARRDDRIRVLSQENRGLTHALIRGCAEAGADVIARHDCGDRSLPERFERQFELLVGAGHAVVSCATRVCDAQGDLLYEWSAAGPEIRDSLLHDDAARIRAVVHPTAMFRRDTYIAAGGYRPQFRLAQDLDLWIRMARLGTFAVVQEPSYEFVFEPRGISGGNRNAQRRLTEIAVALRDGGDPEELLARASTIRPASVTRQSEAAALYFVARCLRRQNNPKWRSVIRRAVTKNPLHWRAWASLILNR
jgi:glycosyltransferase involved in cell wall biosynthesis